MIDDVLFFLAAMAGFYGICVLMYLAAVLYDLCRVKIAGAMAWLDTFKTPFADQVDGI